MAKLKITEGQYNKLQRRLVEEIHPSDAYNDSDSIQTVLDGRRDVGFICDYAPHTKILIQKVIDAGFKTIPVEQKGFGRSAYVFYRNGAEDEANRLAKIARKNNGFLPTKSPEETYVIGILLGYDKLSVRDFVQSKFPDFKFY